MKKFIVFLMVCLFSFVGIAFASDNFGLIASADVVSKYVDRGILKNDGSTAVVAAGIDFYGFNAQVKSFNYLTNSSGASLKNKFVETDFTLSHTAKFNPVFTTVGATYYTYPKYNLESKVNNLELFAGIGADWFIVPMTVVYVDPDVSGIYGEASLSKRVTLGKFEVAGKGAVGYSTSDWAKNVYGLNENKFTNAEVSGEVLYKIWKFKVGPEIAYSKLLNDSTLTQNKDQTWYGAKLVLEF